MRMQNVFFFSDLLDYSRIGSSPKFTVPAFHLQLLNQTPPHSPILFTETLRVSSLGQPVRKSAETFSTLFLLTSSSLISGRLSGTHSSVTQLLKR